jgi:lysophospholipase L1-like esterase
MWCGLAVILTTLAFGLAVVTSAAGATPSSQVGPPNRPGLYLGLGDSVAAGIGASVPEEGGYVPQAFQMLQANGGGVDALANLAIPGETTTSFITDGQLEQAVAIIVDPATDIQVVSLTIGANDLLGLLLGGPCPVDPSGAACQQFVAEAMDTFAQNYAFILDQLAEPLAERGAGDALFVTTYYNPFSGTRTVLDAPVDTVLLGADGVIDCDAAAADPSAMGVNDIIACVGADHGAHIVDIQPPFANRALLLTNILRRDVHPNNTGHRVIAATLTDAVTAAHAPGIAGAP